MLDERNRLIPNLLRFGNFEAGYGFAPLWPRAYLGCTRFGRVVLARVVLGCTLPFNRRD